MADAVMVAKARRVTAAAVLALLAVCLAAGGRAAVAGPGTEAVAAQTVVRVSPPSQASYVNQTLGLDIYVADVASLYGAEVRLAFNPAVLAVQDADPAKPSVQVALGPLLTSGAGGYFTVLNTANNVSGTVGVALTQLNPSEPVSGSGVLAHIDMLAKAAGTSAITISNATLSDRNGMAIAAAWQGGAISVQTRVMPHHLWLPWVKRP